MKTKVSMLFLALLLVIVGFFGVYYISQSDSNIKGTKSGVPESTESSIPENQSVRLFENETFYEIENLLRILGSISGLQVIEIVDASFEWQTEGTNIEIVGKGLIIPSAAEETQNELIAYFESNEFQTNELNTEIDNVGMRYGFEKENVVCILRSSAIEGSENFKIEVRCGPNETGDTNSEEEGPAENTAETNTEIVEEEDENENTLAELKTLFSEKYEVETSLINIEITKQLGDYISGTVYFLEEGQLEPEPGNAGGFLSAKDAEGNWTIVYDGNGTVPCESLESYDFPVEIISECFDQNTQTIVVLTE